MELHRTLTIGFYGKKKGSLCYFESVVYLHNLNKPKTIDSRYNENSRGNLNGKCLL